MNKIILTSILTVCSAIIVGLTGWNFKVTADIPAKYVSKEEYTIQKEEYKKDIVRYMNQNDIDHRTIENKLDRIMELIVQMYRQQNDRDEKQTHQFEHEEEE